MQRKPYLHQHWGWCIIKRNSLELLIEEQKIFSFTAKAQEGTACQHLIKSVTQPRTEPTFLSGSPASWTHPPYQRKAGRNALTVQIHTRKLNLPNQENTPSCLWNASFQVKRNLSHLINVTHMPHAVLHYLSNGLEPAEKYDNRGTALSTHPGHLPTGQMGSAQGSTSQCPLFPLRNHLCQVTLRKRGGESEKPGLFNVQMQEKLWNRYKCCILVTDGAGLGFFFPAQVISFSIQKKVVGATTSRKYKEETSS